MTGRKRTKMAPFTPTQRPKKIFPAPLFPAPGASTALGATPSPSADSIANSVTAKLDSVRTILADNSGDNTALVTALNVLLVVVENQQKLLKQQQSMIDSWTAKRSTSVINDDEAEAKERRRSLVIVGMPESAGLPSDRRRKDREQLSKLFDEIDVETEVTATYRMGERKDGRPRLTKVVLAASHQQRAVLAAAKKLKTSGVFKGVYVRPSLTQSERDEDFRLRKELLEIRKSGKRAIIKGWPGQERKIVVFPDQGNH